MRDRPQGAGQRAGEPTKGTTALKLRHKLLLVSLATLLLPVAGWLYLRQMDTVLRQAQEHALLASAQLLARTVNGWVRLPARPAWHVQHSVLPLVVDGYAEDWSRLAAWAEPAGPAASLLLGEHAGQIYLLLAVTDATADRLQPGSTAAAADHVDLWLGIKGARCQYRLAATAPGVVAAAPLGTASSACIDPLRAQWQRDGSGYRIELRLPAAARLGYLGVRAVDASAAGPAAPMALRPVQRVSPDVSRRLAALLPAGQRVRLLDRSGWIVAEGGRLGHGGSAGPPGWLATLAYKLLVAQPMGGSRALDRSGPQVEALEVWQALSGVPATSWRSSVAHGRVTLAAAAPLPGAGDTRGVIVLEQSARAMPLLDHRGLLWLLLGSLVLLLLAGAVLVGFALRLGARLGRLRDAVRRATEHPEQAAAIAPLPGADTADELGDLARDHQRLLVSVAGYTEYLRALASRLAHELGTPLAIVQSSLDNLDRAELPADQQAYVARAWEGARRMTGLVRQMGAAGRIERLIAQAEVEDFDLRMLVAGCAEGYRMLAGERRFEVQLPEAPLLLHGAPDLLVQALDKLFDNARSFTPDDGWIRLSLRADDAGGAVIALANQGPPLPDTDDARLFDSLVSLREGGAASATPHLGLGLYIVRMVVRHHHGRAEAANLADGDGVVFRLHLGNV